MTAPYAVSNEDGSAPVPAIGECCCHCGSAHVKILMAQPASAVGHGEHLAFVDPKPAAPPKPTLLVPGRRPEILH